MLSKEENGQSVNNRSVNVVNNLLSEEQIADMATLFKMMSDPTRLRIINMLLISELCVHALRNSRLIKFRREGKQIFYSLDDEHIGQLFKQCLEHAKEK